VRRRGRDPGPTVRGVRQHVRDDAGRDGSETRRQRHSEADRDGAGPAAAAHGRRRIRSGRVGRQRAHPGRRPRIARGGPAGAYGSWLLLVASVVFYAKGGGRFTLLMLASIAFNYSIAIAIDRRRDTGGARPLLTFAVAANLVVLGIFKYSNFFADNVNTLFL